MNSREAFNEAYDAYADALFRYALLKLDSRERALDAVQDAFAKTWQYLADGHTIESWKSFLYRVLHNIVVNEYSKHKTVSLEVLVESGFDPGLDERERLEDQLDGARALALLRELPEEYQSAVFMRYVEGLSLTEMADITGETKNVLAVRVFRGLRKLKKLYEHA